MSKNSTLLTSILVPLGHQKTPKVASGKVPNKHVKTQSAPKSATCPNNIKNELPCSSSLVFRSSFFLPWAHLGPKWAPGLPRDPPREGLSSICCVFLALFGRSGDPTIKVFRSRILFHRILDTTTRWNKLGGTKPSITQSHPPPSTSAIDAQSCPSHQPHQNKNITVLRLTGYLSFQLTGCLSTGDKGLAAGGAALRI